MDNLTPITREEMLMNDEPLTPITREEKILAGEDLECVTRREYFLKKYRHAGGDVMVEGLSVTENGTYTAPEGKAYSPVEVAVPLPENAYLLKEASGSLVSFSDGADLPIPSFICNIDAVQDLHGYDAPWVGGAGKNKAESVANDWSNKGITATKNDDGSYSITGTATENVTSNFLINVYPVSVGEEYIVTNKKNQTDTATKYSRCVCSFYNDSTYKSEINVNEGQTITVPSGVNRLRLSYVWFNGFVVPTGAIIYPMVRLATETDSTFAPYSNICPISGHTGVDAWVRGKNLWSFGDITQLIDGAAFSLKAGTYTIKADVSNVGTTLVGLRMFYADDTNILVTLSNTNNYQKTFTLTDDVVKINASVTNGTATNVQLELGETTTTFEPYNPSSQTISISWQTEAGEVFGGYIDLVSGKLTATHIITTYDGSNDENWGQNTSYNLFNISIPSDYRVEQTPISNLYKGLEPQSASNLSTKANGSFALYSTYGGINIKTDVAEDVAGFKTYLSQNNLQVLYKLATPQTYQLTPTQIKSLLGNNNAWCSIGDVDIDYFAKEVTG